MKRGANLPILLLVMLAVLAMVAVGPGAVPAKPVPGMAMNLPAPKLAGNERDWLNTGGKKLEFERGRVYVVEFWTFGCINCQHNLAAYARWQKRFEKEGLTIIGIHSPETEAEKKTENVIEQVKKLGITYPVLLDQSLVNWTNWKQEFWPAIYLVDKRGQVRYRWLGELEWKNAGGEATMGKAIEKLLSEPVDGRAGTRPNQAK
jgi:thiol-disulfide isomerase/thioredoxin